VHLSSEVSLASVGGMMKSALCLILVTGIAAHGAQREPLNTAWKFARYGAMPDGSRLAETPASAADFDDSKWRTLNLPHDWGIEGPFRAELSNNTGKLPWAGIGWYRKTLDLPAADQGKMIYLDFDGAMAAPKVFVNGQLAGEWHYGYNSFRIDITPFVKFGGVNSIAVRLENMANSSRWYPGSGIYRHVWLVKAEPTHIAYHGVFVRSENLTASSADVIVSTEVQGTADGVSTVHTLLDATGKVVGSSSAESGTARITVKSPVLWDLQHPHLYTMRTRLVRNGKTLDSEDTLFGIRSAVWKTDGFYLNGTRVQIKGVCNHHDLGALGSAFNTRAAERQIEILQQMGCNSIRTSHNPPAPELLDLCDRMGMLVLDELFDVWKIPKQDDDYHRHFDKWHEQDVANFIRRDRNHPCVIAWSTGNEVAEQGRKEMLWVSEKLTKLVRNHDDTRKITVGINLLNNAATPFADSVDITGLNYPAKDGKIVAKIRARKPDVPILTTESASCVSSRGCYFFPVKWDKGSGFRGFHVSSYELYAPPWANRPDLDFEMLERHPSVAGEYVWTGFDYIGEPTPFHIDKTNSLNFDNEEERKKAMETFDQLGGKSPARSSYFGILDLAGFPKDRYYLYQAHWRPDFKMAHILPHWDWPERIGQVTPVHVFTSGDEAELFLNGTSLGRKKKEPYQYRIVWDDVIYQPGTLIVKTWKNGRPWAEADRSTAGTATQLLVKADRPTIKADGEDLSYVTITVADEKGRLVPRSMHRLHFSISGGVEIAGVCNGDPTSLESMQGTSMPAFNGLCQVILRGKRGMPGPATLTISSEGLPTAKVTITTK